MQVGKDANLPLYRGFSRHMNKSTHPTDSKSMADEDILVLDTSGNLFPKFGSGKVGHRRKEPLLVLAVEPRSRPCNVRAESESLGTYCVGLACTSGPIRVSTFGQRHSRTETEQAFGLRQAALPKALQAGLEHPRSRARTGSGDSLGQLVCWPGPNAMRA